MKMTTTSCLCIMLISNLLFTTVSAQYKIYDSRQEKEIDLQELIDRCAQSRIVLFGEQHDDSVGHVLEYELFKGLSKIHPGNTVLSLEMFEWDVQPVLNEYLKGLITENHFNRAARLWDNYETDYKPLIEHAKAEGLPVLAANAPRRYVNMVSRMGLESLDQLDSLTRAQYLPPLPITLLEGLYFKKFQEIMGDGIHLDNKFYASQNLWDAAMAYAIHRGFEQHQPAVLLHLNGAFHSNFHTGLTERLAQDYAFKPLTISINKTDNLEEVDWTTWKDYGDFIILTPAPLD